MRQNQLFASIVVILFVIAVIYYSEGNRYRNVTADINSVGKYTGETATTTRVKAAIALNKQVSSFGIQVETTGNSVTLSGQVPTENEKRIAEEIARSTNGVAIVVNNLQVDPKIQAANAERR